MCSYYPCGFRGWECTKACLGLALLPTICKEALYLASPCPLATLAMCGTSPFAARPSPYKHCPGFAMHIFPTIAEERIRAAQERGDFENLPGSGKPLVLVDDSAIPEDLRMAYKVLRNSGFLPPELADRKEISRVLDLLEGCEDVRTVAAEMRRLDAILFRMRQRGRNILLEEQDEYYKKVVSRMGDIKKRFGSLHYPLP